MYGSKGRKLLPSVARTELVVMKVAGNSVSLDRNARVSFIVRANSKPFSSPRTFLRLSRRRSRDDEVSSGEDFRNGEIVRFLSRLYFAAKSST